MRAVWSFSLIALACGGRTFGDPIFDETGQGGSLAPGGRASGGAVTHSGGSGGRSGSGGSVATSGGRVPSTGGVPALTGGRSSTGGVSPASGGVTTTTGGVSFGGSFGFGGRIGSGGVVATGGSGGAPFIDKACARVCSKVGDLCGTPTGSNDECAIECSQPLNSSSSRCQAASRNLIECMNRSLALPGASCSSIPALVLLTCAEFLRAVASCNDTPPIPPEQCSESLVGQETGCIRTRTCGVNAYETTCSALPGFASCVCRVDGKLTSKAGFSGAFDACSLTMDFSCP